MVPRRAMADPSELAGLLAAKRHRSLGPDSRKFMLQPFQSQGNGQPGKCHKLELFPSGLVSCNDGEPHGAWRQWDLYLTVNFHWNALPKWKSHLFRPISGTDGWIQVDCDPAWRTCLIPCVEDTGMADATGTLLSLGAQFAASSRERAFSLGIISLLTNQSGQLLFWANSGASPLPDYQFLRG